MDAKQSIAAQSNHVGNRGTLGVCPAPQSLTNVRPIPTTSSPRTTNGPRIFLTNEATQGRRPGSGSALAGTVTVQWSTASKRDYAASGTLRACSSSTSRRLTAEWISVPRQSFLREGSPNPSLRQR